MKFLSVFFVLISLLARGQEGFLLQNVEKEVIKFKLINNLIFIPLTINGAEVTFLLDTGISETILFSQTEQDINLKNVEKINFRGLGEQTSIEGIQSVNNRMVIGKNFIDPSHKIYLILDESFNISQDIGFPINGIIGYYFFKNHPIEINYIKQTITIYRNPDVLPKKIRRYAEFPMTIEGNKPFLIADVEMKNTKQASKLLLDLGNTDAVWLFPSLIKDFVYNRPNIDDFLGRGFSGDIYGKRSRINALYIGDFKFNKLIAAMPDEYSIQHLQIVKDRKGSVGSEIIRRYNVVLDYPNQKLYLKPNKYYDDPFLIDGSGLEIKQDGIVWEREQVRIETSKVSQTANEMSFDANGERFQYKFSLKPLFKIVGTRKDSPAQKAGILKGDELISINGKKASDLTLQKIQSILKTHQSKIVELQLRRDEKVIKLDLLLEDPIPYIEN